MPGRTFESLDIADLVLQFVKGTRLVGDGRRAQPGIRPQPSRWSVCWRLVRERRRVLRPQPVERSVVWLIVRTHGIVGRRLWSRAVVVRGLRYWLWPDLCLRELRLRLRLRLGLRDE